MGGCFKIIGYIFLGIVGLGVLGAIVNEFGDGSETEKRVVNTPVLNVRGGPGSNFDKVGEKEKGQKIEVKRDSIGWIQIENNQAAGWIKKEFTVTASKYKKLQKQGDSKGTEDRSEAKSQSEPDDDGSSGPTMPEVGEVFRLRHSAAPSFLARSGSWDAMSEAVNAGDKVGVKRLMRQNKVVFINDDKRGRILDVGMTSYKIRITKGPNSGKAGWVYRELIVGK